MDKISIIVPVYNVEEYLEKCIDSIINQTYSNIEIILVNDGSTDNSSKICDLYADKDNRIKVIHKENGGLSDARNAGINIATGEYITLVDSDDYIDLDYVEFLYKLIKKEKHIDMSICSKSAIYSNGTILKRDFDEFAVLDSKEILKRILYSDKIGVSAWGKMYSKEIFKHIRYPKGRVFEDAATTYKLILNSNKISIGLKSKYNYIIRNNSITNNTFSEKKMDLITSTQEMCYDIKKVYPDLKVACDRRLMYAYLSTLSQLAMSKKKFPKEQRIMMDYIKENRKEILKDKSIPRRDRIALISTKFGFISFKIMWNIYRRVTGRKK